MKSFIDHLLETELNELDKSTLSSYERKATVDYASKRLNGDAKGAEKRRAGVKLARQKTNEDVELHEDNEHYDKAERHLSKANDAEAKGDMISFHAHMADHHDAMSEWHDSKGRSASADKHAEKADMHHEKAMALKESFGPMMAAGRQSDRNSSNDNERGLGSLAPSTAPKKPLSALQQLKRKNAARKVKEEVKESVDDNRTGFTKKKREDDEYHNEPKPKFKAKSLKDRPHTVHVDGKPWKKFDNGHQAEAAAKTLRAKGKKATAIAHFKEHLDEADDATSKREKAMAEFDKQSREAYWKKHAELKKNAKPVKEEALDEIKMTAAMKLQQAFQREQEKTARERKAGEDFLKKKEEPKKTNEEVESVEEGLKPEHNMRPGWMLKADPELAKKIADKKRKFKTFKDTVGKKKD